MINRFRVNITLQSRIVFWIEIECLDLPVVNRWYNSAKITYQNNAKITSNRNPSFLSNPPMTLVKTRYQKIITAIETLKKLGVNWPVNEPSEFNFTTDWCNRVHRYFTTMSFTRNRLDFKSSETFSIDTNNPMYINALHTINNEIHELENYCLSPQKQLFLQTLNFLSIKPKDYQPESYFENYRFHKFEIDDYQYHTWDKCDVVFEDEILGKHILTSFFDNDNPKNIDTGGYKGWYGGFKIYSDCVRQDIYNSKEFSDWLTMHKVDKKQARADYPIGNISQTSHDINEICLQCQNDNLIVDVNLEFLN